MSTSVGTQHPKIIHKCNTHEIVVAPLNNEASKLHNVIMLETSFVQRHNAGCKNGIQKLKITTVDLSLKRRTQKNTYLRVVFILKAMLTTTETSSTSATNARETLKISYLIWKSHTTPVSTSGNYCPQQIGNQVLKCNTTQNLISRHETTSKTK
jgi:hypothetical protein